MHGLLNTQEAFAELRTPNSLMFGLHDHRQPRVGGMGLKIGEVTFDPQLHRPDYINPMAVMGLATGESYVDMVLPVHPLNLNIVTHHDPKMDRSELAPMQYELAMQLEEALRDSMPQAGDYIRSYHIGDEPKGLNWRDIDEVISTNSPEQAVEEVAEIALSGLTMVISSFNSLPLDTAGDTDWSRTIGVKVNHPADFEIPAGVEIAGIKTERDRLAANQRLGEYHRRLDERLVGAGLKMGHVVLDLSRINRGVLFDDVKADDSIATAIRELY